MLLDVETTTTLKRTLGAAPSEGDEASEPGLVERVAPGERKPRYRFEELDRPR